MGTPEQIDVRPLWALWDAGYVLVVAPVSSGPSGESVNVNADEAALGIARALGTRSLVYLSDVDGVRVGGTVVERLLASEVESRIADGTIAGGMALKVRVALDASSGGIPEVVVAGKARLTGGFRGTVIEAARPHAAEVKG